MPCGTLPGGCRRWSACSTKVEGVEAHQLADTCHDSEYFGGADDLIIGVCCVSSASPWIRKLSCDCQFIAMRLGAQSVSHHSRTSDRQNWLASSLTTYKFNLGGSAIERGNQDVSVENWHIIMMIYVRAFQIQCNRDTWMCDYLSSRRFPWAPLSLKHPKPNAAALRLQEFRCLEIFPVWRTGRMLR